MRETRSAAHTLLERCSAGTKLVAISVTGLVLAIVTERVVLVVTLAATIGLVMSLRLSWRDLRRPLFTVLTMSGAVLIATALLDDSGEAIVNAIRLLTILLLALSITLSTSASDMLDAFSKALVPFERAGLLQAERVSLGLTLAVRFVPEIAQQYREISEAQAARGLQVSLVALVVPLVVRTLKRAESIAEAIEARSYPPPRAPASTQTQRSRG